MIRIAPVSMYPAALLYNLTTSCGFVHVQHITMVTGTRQAVRDFPWVIW
jgi:hypothetical protein